MSNRLQNAGQKLIDDFGLFDTWEDRYRYIIELGGGLEPLGDEYQVESHRVQGCVSSVWLIREDGNGDSTIHFRADSNSQLVKGLIAIVLLIYSGRTALEIIGFDINDLFERLDLRQHISRSRSNGLNSMVQRIKTLAVEHEADTNRPPPSELPSPQSD